MHRGHRALRPGGPRTAASPRGHAHVFAPGSGQPAGPHPSCVHSCEKAGTAAIVRSVLFLHRCKRTRFVFTYLCGFVVFLHLMRLSRCNGLPPYVRTHAGLQSAGPVGQGCGSGLSASSLGIGLRNETFSLFLAWDSVRTDLQGSWLPWVSMWPCLPSEGSAGFSPTAQV